MSKIKHLYGLYHSLYIFILLTMTFVEEIGHWVAWWQWWRIACKATIDALYALVFRLHIYSIHFEMYILYEFQIWLAASKRAQMYTFYEFYKQNGKKEDFLKSTQRIYINIVYITLACYVILCSLYNILQYPISSESIRIFVLVP